MENEIKVGEYVRNTFGDIYIYDYSGHPMLLEDKFYNRVVKHSKNIIDLIEVGDYVNGHLVLKVEEDGFLLVDDKGYTHLAPINIKSIVTKEQFASMEYKIKE